MEKKDRIDLKNIAFCCNQMDKALKKKVLKIDDLGFFYLEDMREVFYYCPWCGMATFEDADQ